MIFKTMGYMEAEKALERYEHSVKNLVEQYMARYEDLYTEEQNMKTAREFLSNYNEDYKSEIAVVASSMLHMCEKQEELKKMISQHQSGANGLFRELSRHITNDVININ